MEPLFWLGGFALLAAVDIAAWCRRDDRTRWAWSLWFAPATLGLYGLGWALGTLEQSEPTVATWIAMTLAAALGVVPSLVSAIRSSGTARGLALLNATVLASLAIRVTAFVRGIELM